MELQIGAFDEMQIKESDLLVAPFRSMNPEEKKKLLQLSQRLVDLNPYLMYIYREKFMKLLIILASALFLGACSASVDSSKMIPPATSSEMTVAVPQSFEIKIDGHLFVLKPDEPTNGNVIIASIVNGAHLNISAMSKTNNFFFSTYFHAGALVPGSYEVFNCYEPQVCEDDHQVNASIMPSDLAEYTEMKKAYKHPSLGMVPMTVVITSIDDVMWPGAGPSKRIKGTFSGKLGGIEGNGDTAHLKGPVKQVEGKFDLYTVLR